MRIRASVNEILVFALRAEVARVASQVFEQHAPAYPQDEGAETLRLVHLPQLDAREHPSDRLLAHIVDQIRAAQPIPEHRIEQSYKILSKVLLNIGCAGA